MNEGWFINYATGKKFLIHEHETWIREPKNAKKLGIPPSAAKIFTKFKPVVDRDKFLLYLMQQFPIMRVRGHGSYISFEFNSHSRQSAMESVLMFGKEYAGPFTTMNVVNFATGEKVEMPFVTFEELMDTNGAEGVLRAASQVTVKTSILRELVSMAADILAESK